MRLVLLKGPQLGLFGGQPSKPVKNPGSRGGKFFFDKQGEAQYGERPTGKPPAGQMDLVRTKPGPAQKKLTDPGATPATDAAAKLRGQVLELKQEWTRERPAAGSPEFAKLKGRVIEALKEAERAAGGDQAAGRFLGGLQRVRKQLEGAEKGEPQPKMVADAWRQVRGNRDSPQAAQLVGRRLWQQARQSGDRKEVEAALAELKSLDARHGDMENYVLAVEHVARKLGGGSAPAAKEGGASRAAAKKGRGSRAAAKTPVPEVFYRGTNPGDTRRIAEPFEAGKGKTFMARGAKSAGVYGREIEEIRPKPGARILMQEDPAFWKMLGKRRPANGDIASLPGGPVPHVNEAIKRAEAAGYHAVSFSRDSDIGTVILDESGFARTKGAQA